MRVQLLEHHVFNLKGGGGSIMLGAGSIVSDTGAAGEYPISNLLGGTLQVTNGMKDLDAAATSALATEATRAAGYGVRPRVPFTAPGAVKQRGTFKDATGADTPNQWRTFSFISDF